MNNAETMAQFWEHIATNSIGIIVTMIGFWFVLGRNMITRQEALEMVKTHSPYLEDRQFIMEKLASNKESQILMTGMLQRNTEVMMELKIQIATLGNTLEALEARIDRNQTHDK